VCGKTATVANLQDLLTFELKGLAAYCRFARTRGIDTAEVDSFFKAAVFSTLTNVNFDPERFRGYVLRADALTQGLRKRLGGAGPPAAAVPWFDSYHPVSLSIEAALGTATPTVEALELLAETVSLHHRKAVMGPEGATLLGLHELVAYGLRGVAAYGHHAHMLGAVDPALDDLYEETLAFLASPEAADAGAVLAAAMKLGEANFRTMKLLDGAHCSKFGNPTPTQVRLTPVEGKAILVSGHGEERNQAPFSLGGLGGGGGGVVALPFCLLVSCVVICIGLCFFVSNKQLFITRITISLSTPTPQPQLTKNNQTSRTLATCSSRSSAPAPTSTSTRTARCCRRTATRACTSTPRLLATMEAPGTSRRRNFRPSPAPSS
jgi:hypothetical protein